MALITKIRNNTPLLIILIGGGMAAFLLMDMLGNNSGIVGNQNSVGSINGKKVTIQEFENQMNLSSNTQTDVLAQRKNLWDKMVLQSLVDKSSEKLGLGVGETEMEALLTANDPNSSSLLYQTFADPQTRQIDQETLNYFKTNAQTGGLQPGQQQFWDGFLKDVVLERKASKLTNLVSKAVYTPTWQIQAENKSQKVDFNYVSIPFADAGTVNVSDDELKTYLSTNQARYSNKEESRTVNYVTFDVYPTVADSANLRSEMKELADGFNTSTQGDSSYVTQNFGNYDAAYYLKSELEGYPIVDELFSAEPGSVFGPYIDGNRYVVTKLIDRKIIPDSVKARHILIAVDRPDINIQAVTAAQARVDSFKQVIAAGTEPFDSIAARFSDDKSNNFNGGDLGYFARGRMVKPFNDLCFYKAEEGGMYSVVTQFGVHLIKVEDLKGGTEAGINAGIISKPIIPSAKTQDDLYRKAYDFARNNRTLASMQEAAKTDNSIKLQSAYSLGINDFQVGDLEEGQSSRKIVQWAYKANKGDVSPDIYTFTDQVEYFKNKYIVVALEDKTAAGPMSLGAARSQILPIVENQKRAESLKAKISGKSLEEIATDFDSEVRTANKVSIASGDQFLRNEPNVIAAALGVNANQQSAPIVGKNGIYIVQTISKEATPDLTNIAQLKSTSNTSARSRISANLIESMRKMAKIKDNRNTFF